MVIEIKMKNNTLTIKEEELNLMGLKDLSDLRKQLNKEIKRRKNLIKKQVK
jgi:hypothetical protein